MQFEWGCRGLWWMSSDCVIIGCVGTGLLVGCGRCGLSGVCNACLEWMRALIVWM